ncbi:hypothetical protein Tcan_03920 [Toxocara canis]|uniref:Uncharacterized protein n=1 Tax=Toxocara canis TaxID=6265 RepID=A0A0B2W265_TOXCA|nr:hypothetical protein Tcan_03920 [Toxocara canis]
MKLLSERISNWISGLDNDGGDFLSTGARGECKPNIPLIIWPGSLIDDYLSRLSRHICMMAVADSVPSLSYSAQLDAFCRRLCSQIFDMLYAELELRDEREREQFLSAYCDKLASDILKWAYFEIRTGMPICEPTQFSDVWHAFQEEIAEKVELDGLPLAFGEPLHKLSISFDCIQSLARMLQADDLKDRPCSAADVAFEDRSGETFAEQLFYMRD